jgi:LPXTG-motif cell wall-anchored protein
VPITRRLAAPVAAFILTLSPAAALAQSSGDQQYADPFANNGQNQSGGGGSSGGGGGSGGGGSSSSGGGQGQAVPSAGQGQAAPSAGGVAASQAQGTTGTASQGSGTAAQSGSRELPRTGLDAGVVAVLGAVLLLAGLALRRRTADARR